MPGRPDPRRLPRVPKVAPGGAPAPTRAAPYTRVGFLDGWGATNQYRRRDRLVQALSRRPGWSHVADYTDVAPARIAHPPGLGRLLAHARAGLLDVVVVEDLRALAADPRRRRALLAELGASRVRVYPLTDGRARRRSVSSLVALACCELAWE